MLSILFMKMHLENLRVYVYVDYNTSISLPVHVTIYVSTGGGESFRRPTRGILDSKYFRNILLHFPWIAYVRCSRCKGEFSQNLGKADEMFILGRNHK